MKNYGRIFLSLIIYLNFLSTIQIIKSLEIDELPRHILMSFRTESDDKAYDSSPEKFMENLMYRKLYTDYNIGNPWQKIKFYYEMNSYHTQISEDHFEKIRSATYKCLDNKKCPKKTSELNDFILSDKEGYISEEIFELTKDNKMENFTFILKPKGKTDSENTEIPNILGFGLKNNNDNNKNKKPELLSFMEQLKRYNYIDKKIFTPLIGDNAIIETRFFDGYVLVGILPHEVNPLFIEKDLKWISNKDKSKSNGNWYINFDSIKYNNEPIKDTLTILDLNLNIVVGPESFRKKLINGFFKKHLENQICSENLFFNLKDEEHYIFYSCGNDVEFIEIPKLSFYSKALNETFELTFENFFTQYKHRFYFTIIFKKNLNNNWILGQNFLNNYKFVFDAEEERIGYYKSTIQENHPFIAILIIIFALSIFFLFYLCGNKFNIEGDNVYYNQQMQKNIHQQVREEYSDVKSNTNKNIKNNKKGNKKSKKD